jgi:hypothetical protein
VAFGEGGSSNSCISVGPGPGCSRPFELNGCQSFVSAASYVIGYCLLFDVITSRSLAHG